jgi:hypothetical protein
MKPDQEYILEKVSRTWFLWDGKKQLVLGTGSDPAKLVERILRKEETWK